MNLPSHSLREKIYLILILVVVLGYFINVYGYQQTINEYKKAYNECEQNLQLAIMGQLPLDKDVYGKQTSQYMLNWSVNQT